MPKSKIKAAKIRLAELYIQHKLLSKDYKNAKTQKAQKLIEAVQNACWDSADQVIHDLDEKKYGPLTYCSRCFKLGIAFDGLHHRHEKIDSNGDVSSFHCKYNPDLPDYPFERSFE